MKKISMLLSIATVVAVLFAACSGPKNTMSGNTVSRGKFTGDWTLTHVNYEGLLPGAVQTAFDQAPPSAFLGSTWKLTNSGNGLYTLTSGTSQTIYWSVNNNPTGQLFQFKKIYQGDKAKNVEAGYQLVVAGNDGTTMTLKSPVALGSGTAYVVYTFNKIK